MTNKTLIMNHSEIEQKINRIAYELYENYLNEKELYITGIYPKGYQLAEKLITVLKRISPLEIHLVKLELDKDKPLDHPVKTSVDLDSLNGKCVVLVDDVLNSGKTLIYATRYLLGAKLKKMNTVCLVDRTHRRYPVRADFAGLSLSTTLQEHIEVEFSEGNDSVYLQ
jgi:pyrimidine operon attenuation protein/uracil phosphoribosyltransferase